MMALTQMSPAQCLTLIPRPDNPHLRSLGFIVSAAGNPPQGNRSAPPQNNADNAQVISGLGRSSLSTASSNRHAQIPKRKQGKQKREELKEEKQKQETREEGRQISGSDVLWALQRAAVQKKKASSGNKNKNKRQKGLSSSAGIHTGEDSVDYSDVRPLRIKEEWAIKLDELEKRLKELDYTI